MSDRIRLASIMLLALIGLLALACASIPAQQTTPKPAEVKSEKKGSEDVFVKTDFYRRALSGRKTMLLKGNVRFTHVDTVLTSDQVDYDEDARIAVSPGKVVITNPECDITGDKGQAFFKKRLGVVEGGVVMQVKPKKTDETAQDKESVRLKLTKPTTITCAKLEYQYREKIATATGGVVLKQEKRTAKADKLIYDEKKELLTLMGNVSGVDEDGQTFSAPGKVVISTKKGDEWMEAPNANATFRVNLDEDEGPKGK